LLGVGYKHVGTALNGGMALKLMALLLVLKLVAVATCYGSGNAGGIFGPSLFLGAMLGGVVGNVANHLFPHTVGTPGAYALVGMGTAFAGIVRAPMTSVVMIFETTRDYAVIVPLMISNLVSFFISAKLQPKPIYDELATQDGIHLPTAETRKQEAQRAVNQAMREATETLNAEWTAEEALERAEHSEFRAWPVCDSRGVIGVVSLQRLRQATHEGSADKRLMQLVDPGDFPHVHVDHPLYVVLERMGASQLDLLPVVSRANVNQLRGVVTLEDVLAQYGVAEPGEAGKQAR
jgi:CIC family chloride channel protein